MNQHTFCRLALVAVASTLAASVLLSDAQPSPHASPPSPCTRYAAPTGSDGAGGSERRPFKTAQRLVDSLRAGETGCLRAGTYSADDEDYVVRFGRAGLPGRPITLRSHPGARARLVGIVYVARGADHVTLAGLTIEGTGGQTSIAVTADDTTFQGNTITNVRRGKSCMILGSNDGFGEATRTIIRQNRFYDCGSLEHGNKDHAIYAENVVGARIVDNVFWSSAAYAIHLYPNARRTYVARNVIDGGLPSVRGGIVIGGDSSYVSSDNLVEQNVVAYARTANIVSWWEDDKGSGNVVRDNCVWAGKEGNVDTSRGGFVATGNVVAAPRFRNRKNRDYRLRPSSGCKAVVPLLVPRPGS